MPIYAAPSLGAEESAALVRIDELRRQLRYYVAEPRRWVGSVRRVLSAKGIQGSNSIEGFHVSVEDALAAVQGAEPEEAAVAERQAVQGYRRAMTYVIQLAGDQHFTYSPALIRSLHFMMTEDSWEAGPGLWRPQPIWVRNDATGEVVYEAPDSDDVPDLVGELVASLNADSETPAMVRAAMAHLNLVMIHPFRDGNGRMSRALQTLVLAREQILAQELCSIEEYLGRNTQAYYEVLASVGQGRYRPDGDAREWVRFCLRAHYVQAQSVLRRIREAEQIWRRLEELRHEHRLQERTLSALFDATIGLRIKNSSYRTAVASQGEEISNQVATLDLRQMVNASLLTQQGAKRGSSYVAAPLLRAIYGEVRASRVAIDTTRLFLPDDTGQGELPL